ncbi:MAG: hypothetical protein QNJ41_00935 [Xenococcaceae cyanobacterium MO_188.B32]|nr:hypothetical protein [Xenococcaceae cyanobacterium MO_188.B32]
MKISFINNSLVGLEVLPGANITLVGGELDFQSGLVTAPGGRVELGGLSQAGEVTINENGSLSFPEGVERADVTLTNGAEVDVAGDKGGSIKVSGNNISLSGSVLNSSTFVEGDAGNITIEASSLFSADSSTLNNSTFGAGNTGEIRISSDGAVTLSNTIIFNNVEGGGTGNSLGVFINAQSLDVTNGSQIQTLVRGSDQAEVAGNGNAGNVFIDVDEDVTFSASSVFSQLGLGAQGSAGDIIIEAGSLSLSDGATLTSSTFGQGDGGGINITTGSLELLNAARVNASTSGEGNAGKITEHFLSWYQVQKIQEMQVM